MGLSGQTADGQSVPRVHTPPRPGPRLHSPQLRSWYSLAFTSCAPRAPVHVRPCVVGTLIDAAMPLGARPGVSPRLASSLMLLLRDRLPVRPSILPAFPKKKRRMVQGTGGGKLRTDLKRDEGTGSMSRRVGARSPCSCRRFCRSACACRHTLRRVRWPDATRPCSSLSEFVGGCCLVAWETRASTSAKPPTTADF